MNNNMVSQVTEYLYFNCKLKYDEDEQTGYIHNKQINNIRNYVAKTLSIGALNYYGEYHVGSNKDLDKIFKSYEKEYGNGNL